MGRCLEAIVSGRFINYELHTLTGRYVDSFRELSDKFGQLTQVTYKEYELILQAVMHLVGYPIDNPLELEPFLNTRRLHLQWFWYRMMSTEDDWDRHVEEDADAVISAALARGE